MQTTGGKVVLIGLATGLLSGLVGVGGGALMIPAMVLMLGFDQHRAHGTSLAVMPFMVGIGVLTYNHNHQVHWPMAIVLAIGGVVGAAVGAKLASAIHGDTLRKVFAVAVFLVGAKMLYDGITRHHATGTGADLTIMNLSLIAKALPVGLVTGMISGMLGLGGGIVMIPAMVVILGLSQKLAQGISLAVIIPVSISGAMMHYRQGNVSTDCAKWLTLGGVPGILIGATAANHMGGSTLQIIFGGFLFIMSVVLILKHSSGSEELEQEC